MFHATWRVKFGGELNLADWQLEKRTTKLNFAKLLFKLSNWSPSVQARDINQSMLSIDMQLQGKCKRVTSGLDYNVSQVFSSSGTHEGPLSHREPLQLLSSCIVIFFFM